MDSNDLPNNGYLPELFQDPMYQMPMGAVHEVVEAPEIRPFRCNLCTQSFARQETLRDHINGPKHFDKRPFPCFQCPARFTRNADLTRHKKTVHDHQKFVCLAENASGEKSGCGREYTRVNALRTHQHKCKAWSTPPLQSRSVTAISKDENDPDVPPCSPQANKRNHSMISAAYPEDTATQESVSHNQSVPTSTMSPKDKNYLYCPVCTARRELSQKPSFLHHLLEHLEDIYTLAYRCAMCAASFGLREHLIVHQNHCTWTEVTENVCPRIRVEAAGDLVEWGCNIERFQLLTDDKVDSHRAATTTSTCAMNRMRILQILKDKLLGQLERHILYLKDRFPEQGFVNAETLGYIRYEIHKIDASVYRKEENRASRTAQEMTDHFRPLHEQDRQSRKLKVKLLPYQETLASSHYQISPGS